MAPAAVNALNEALRKERHTFALPDHSGYVAFQMDAYSYWYWTHVIPDLGVSDAQIARRAWIKFLNTDAGARYKVNPTEGKRMPVDRIIVR
jgi:hypothetical protein